MKHLLRSGAVAAMVFSFSAQASAQLFDQEALVSCAGCGAGGADVSEDTSGAIGYNLTGTFRLLDDFTVPAGGWNASTFTVYGYMTGSPTTPSPFTTVTLQIWSGDPNAGGTIIAGDTTTNVLTSSVWTNAYRIQGGTAQSSTARPIFANTCTLPVNLAPGSYWIDFAAAGMAGFTGPWMPTNPSSGSGGTSYQFNGTAYVALAEEVPFVIEGSGGQGIGTPYCGANANSTGSGAVLVANGSAVAANNNVTLAASGMPNNQFGYFLNSTSQGFVPNPNSSQGNLCLGGAIGRYNGPGLILNTGTSGSFSLMLNLPSTPTPSGPTAIVAGQTWNFQCWYRDLNPAPTSNFTNGVSVPFQ